ncbi:hypothetical protein CHINAEXTREME_17405 [Halobiforma lacisalsi AJ5]|uniref:Uncharacterized protein n=1 Tax=Natronobacterium lacisalsi AJ5 TaxID=358396 RepID=M0LGL7_NATLA|nr:hypothetical protein CHINAEXTREME_17405 [Halobiforma lacisalsi AJ5]EMA31549.1 hypothetical protein C445_13742 [Halobiforma lacisalsi AJ5]
MTPTADRPSDRIPRKFGALCSSDGGTGYTKYSEPASAGDESVPSVWPSRPAAVFRRADAGTISTVACGESGRWHIVINRLVLVGSTTCVSC